MLVEPIAEKINDLIEARDLAAISQLKALASCAFQDKKHRTPLNTAIAANFKEAIIYLINRKETIEFAPAIDADLKLPVKHNVNNMDHPTPYLESYFNTSYGHRMCWERRPLLQACRHQHKEAIELLIGAGAKLDSQDILQKTSLDICLEIGGEELVLYFLNTCKQFKKKCKVTQHQLLSTFKSPRIYDELRSQKLDNSATLFLFNVACAYLNIEEVKRLLAEKFELPKAFKHFSNPVIEACTSHMLSVHHLPDYTIYAHLFAREEISAPQPNPANAEEEYLALLTDNEKRSEFLAGNKIWRSEVANLYQRRRSPNVESQELARQLSLRLKLLDILFAAGATPSLTEEYYPYYFPEYFFCMGEISLLENLKSHGIRLNLTEPTKSELIEELQKRNLRLVIDYINQFDMADCQAE